MQSTTTRSTVVGVFADRAHAQEAVEELRDAGFGEDQIGFVARDHLPGTTKTGATGAHVAEGAAIGATAGAGIGALWCLGIAAGVMPVIGPVIAGGLLANCIVSALGGAAVWGIVGALVGLGIPEEEAKYYESEFKSGRILVTVKANGRCEEAYSILRRYGAYDIRNRAAQRTAPPNPKYQAGGYTAGLQRSPVREPESSGSAGAEEEVPGHTTIDVPVTRETGRTDRE